MTLTRNLGYLRSLLQEVVSLPREAEWVEFMSGAETTFHKEGVFH